SPLLLFSPMICARATTERPAADRNIDLQLMSRFQLVSKAFFHHRPQDLESALVAAICLGGSDRSQLIFQFSKTTGKEDGGGSHDAPLPLRFSWIQEEFCIIACKPGNCFCGLF